MIHLPCRKLKVMDPLRELRTPFQPDPVWGPFFFLVSLLVGLNLEQRPSLAQDFPKLRFSNTDTAFEGLHKSSWALLSTVPASNCFHARSDNRGREQQGWATGRKGESRRRWGGLEAARQREARGFIN